MANNSQDWFRPWSNDRSPSDVSDSGISDSASISSTSSMPSSSASSSPPAPTNHSPLPSPSDGWSTDNGSSASSTPLLSSPSSPATVGHHGPVFDVAQFPFSTASSNVPLSYPFAGSVSPSYIQHSYQFADPAAAAAAINYQRSYVGAPSIYPMPHFGHSYQLSPAAAGAQYAADVADYQLAHQSLLAQDALAKQQKQSARPLRPKKHVCSLCHVAFSNRGQLLGHERSHTGERPFSCDEPGCGKAFTRNEELTRHKRIHSGEKPFACDQCPKSFGRRDHLKKHMLTHQPSAGVPLHMQYAPQYPAPYPIPSLQYQINQLAMMMYPRTG